MVLMAVRPSTFTNPIQTSNMSPVLFLDIDGVLNSAFYLRNNPNCFHRGEDQANAIDPVAGTRLEQILTRTGAVMVLSSTWRLMNTVEQVTDFLKKRGVPSAKFIGATPVLSGYRGKEIQAWLKSHSNVVRFAIVDDDSDMDPFQEKLVKTSWETGLLDEHVEELIKKLLKPVDFSKNLL